jgi:hypothetical protein
VDELGVDKSRLLRGLVCLLVVALCEAVVVFGSPNMSFAGAVTKWTISLATGSKAESQAQPAITTAASNPVTFTAACVNATSEQAVLVWTSAGTAVTGYAVYVSATVNGTFALDTTQPTGTALTVTETYTTAAKKFYRLEAKSANWAFPGTTITNAREVSVAGTIGGYLTMAKTGTECTATA